MSSIETMNLESRDPAKGRIEQLKELFPEVSTEGSGSVDFEKLRLILGDEVNADDERYAFTWPGKRDAIRQSQAQSSATLRPAVDESRSRDGVDGAFDSDNIYIEGDNLEALKLLQHSYHGKVKMIYIDPPYNTGHDFVYKDSFSDTIENYKLQADLSGQSNADTSGRYHSDWCSMMYPRLHLARELLTEDGVLLLSIDDCERDSLKKMSDEIFGESNFIASCIWQKAKKGDSKFISNAHEYILIYAKSKSYLTSIGTVWRRPKQGLEKIFSHYAELREIYGCDHKEIQGKMKSWYKSLADSDPAKLSSHYCCSDERGLYFPDNFAGPNDGRKNRPRYDIIHPITGKPCKLPSTGWRWEESRTQAALAEEPPRIHFGETHETVPCRKSYLFEVNSEPFSSVFYKDGRSASRIVDDLVGKGVFDFPKDVDVIADFIKLVSSDNDLILDFFSGSGTTAHAVMKVNAATQGGRRYIAVQLPERVPEGSAAANAGFDNLAQIGEERIRRAGTKIAAEIEESNKQLKLGEDPKLIPDIGFRVFKLDESGISRQDLNDAAESGKLFDGDSLLDSVVKPTRSDMDIVFEMMLKWGLELTLPVEKTDVSGYQCYVVAGGELVCCMEAGLTVETLEAIAEIEPRRVLMLDSILTDTLKLNAVQIFKRVGERTGVEVELRTV